MRILALLLALLAAPAAAQDYGVLVIGSEHVGDETLNDFNPGLGFGRRTGGPMGLEANVEGGVFLNSYDEIAPYALYGLSGAVAQVGASEIRLGGFAGLFRYEELSVIFERDYGIPNVGGFIPLVGLTGSVRTGKTDVRISALPPGAGVDAVLNLSIAREF